ncbi:MAG: N-6 DNA methylase [Thaumarchaeota archaeon]|nr:N-6 DNA methylase [Nitrososphaerota archaeon]
MQSTKLKKRLFGQFYTPPSIVRLITRLAIRSKTDRILDPAAGDGIFLEGAYHRLLELGASSDDARKQIAGAEIDEGACTKARNRFTNPPTILNGSFFEAELGKFDAIIGNPPYIEQREIGGKQNKLSIRDAALTFDRKQIRMNARADIYAYFITHSTKFLKEGGFLGFILSSSWLDSVWGRDLQKFLLQNFLIHSIIASGRDVFSEALVETVTVILQKKSGYPNARSRDKNHAKFLLIKKETNFEGLIKHAEKTSTSYEDESVRVVIKRQGDLSQIDHWSVIFRTSALYEKLLHNEKMVPLQELADVEYSFKEGAYDFFILSDEEARDFNIEGQYLKPVVSSPASIKTFDLTREDVKEKILLADEPKSRLEDGVLTYIKYGEGKKLRIKRGHLRGRSVVGYHRLPTFRHKRIWYSLRRGELSPILVPAFVRNRFFAIKNDADAYATANFYGIKPHNTKYVLPLLAYLNSSIAALLLELKAKTSMGRGLLDIRSFILRSFLVPDFRKVEEVHNTKLAELFNNLCKAQRAGHRDEMRSIRNSIDCEIINIMRISDEDWYAIAHQLSDLRELRSMKSMAKVLVSAS